MNREIEKQDRPVEDLQQIPTWTRRYAQSRTFPFLVGMVINLLLFLGIFVPSLLAGRTYRSGNFFVFGLWMFVLGIVFVALVFFSMPWWGGKFIEKMGRRFYASEGTATLVPMERVKKKGRLGLLVGLLFGTCVLASIVLGMRGYYPIKYMQPVSVLYCVPFLIFLYFMHRPKISSLSLLWPLLYAIHAILIVTGVPILFTGHYEGLNMFIPVFGYGFLCGLIGHLYNRYALRKLRKLAGGLNGEGSHVGA